MEKYVKGLLSETEWRHIRRLRAECSRLATLDDGALAGLVAEYAREARLLYPALLARSTREMDTYTTAMFWDVIPELAYRLGGVERIEGECRDDVRSADDGAMIQWVDHCMRWVPSIPQGAIERDDATVDPWQLLRWTGAGNPMRIALSRLMPGMAADIDLTEDEPEVPLRSAPPNVKAMFASPTFRTR
jgi:hypothetical protein